MSTTAANSSSLVAMANSPNTLDNGYGRARLMLGIFGVGLWVVISAVFLLIDGAEWVRQQLPEGRLGDFSIVALLLIFYVLIQLPFDWFGGHRTPKHFGRRAQAEGPYTLTLLRGVTVHTALLCTSAFALYFGGALAGITGAFIAALLWLLVLASTRAVLAQLVARLRPATSIRDTADTELMDSDDEGFTGGITGLIRPRTNILAAHRRNHLRPQTFELAMARRQQVMRSGAWLRGRLGAFAFTAVWLLAALLLSGPVQAGTGVGVVETALWFTLWSFAGLLILPTLSRRAVQHIDQQLITSGTDPDRFWPARFRVGPDAGRRAGSTGLDRNHISSDPERIQAARPRSADSIRLLGYRANDGVLEHRGREPVDALGSLQCRPAGTLGVATDRLRLTKRLRLACCQRLAFRDLSGLRRGRDRYRRPLISRSTPRQPMSSRSPAGRTGK